MPKKKILAVISISVFIAALLGFLYYDIGQVWSNQNTWETGEVFSVTDTPNIYVIESGAEKRYYISYCTLTDVTLLEDGRVKYECSFLPYYMINVAKSNHEEFTRLLPDVTFYRTPGEDVLPLSYLDFTNISEEGLESYGELNIPIELDIVIWSQATESTISNKVAHYWEKLRGRKQIQPQKLVSWKVSELKEGLSEEELHNWAEETNYYISMYLEMDDYEGIEVEPLRNLTGYDLMNRLAFEFGYQNYYCAFNELLCTREFDENPASSIMLYLYFLNNREDSFVQTFLETAREKVSPFADDEKLKDKITACEDEDCELDYADMQTYTFPICPIREILVDRNFASDNVSLFMEIEHDYSTKSGKNLYSKEEISSRLIQLIEDAKNYEQLENEATSSSPDHVIHLDSLCYHIVSYNLKEESTLGLLEDAYMEVFSQAYGIMNNEGQTELFTDLSDMKRLVARSYMQLNDEAFVPHERLAYWQMLNEVESRQDFADQKKHTASMPLTLLLMYLYD